MSVPNPPYHETINKLLYGILEHFKGNAIPMNIPKPPYYSTTNDLLYAILQNLNNGSTGGGTVYTQFNVYYVSARYGNDAIAEANNLLKPYKTITQAKLFAGPNDLIHVMEGWYDEGNLFGNYSYWFDYGSEIIYTGAGAIFQQAAGQCRVRGFGRFRCTGTGNAVNVGNWIGSILDMECESMEAVRRTVVLWQNTSPADPNLFQPHRIKAKKVYSSQRNALTISFNAHAVVEIEEIISDSQDESAALFANVKKGLLKNSRITGNQYPPVMFDAVDGEMIVEGCTIISMAASADGHGIVLWENSNGTLRNTSITCTHSSAKSIYTDKRFKLLLDHNVSANRDTGGSVSIIYRNHGAKLILEDSEAVLDITGKTSVDLAEVGNADLVRLVSSNREETLETILNAPTHTSFRIAPQPGLLLTLVSSDAENASASSMVLESPQLKLNGNRGDWIELVNGVYGQGSRQVTASAY